MLEPAIPEHLRVERTVSSKTPENCVPPYPAYCAQFGENVSNLAMAIIGAQFTSREDVEPLAQAKLTEFLDCQDVAEHARPASQEWAANVDNRGFYNIVAIAYWGSRSAYNDWAAKSGFEAWWEGLDAENQSHGWFLEVFFPPMDHFESIFSDDKVPEGEACMRTGVTGPVREHAYWGSMRDRLPAAQTDELNGGARDLKLTERSGARDGARHTRVSSSAAMTVIRSGQDWSDTMGVERELYLTSMHPVLVQGMDFLRDHGRQVGCHSCRFMEIVDPKTLEPQGDRTFGLAYFDNLRSLEGWSKEHDTHRAIFGGFIKYAAQLDNDFKLRVFHEVLVLEERQRLFEYVACHDQTGLLGG